MTTLRASRMSRRRTGRKYSDIAEYSFRRTHVAEHLAGPLLRHNFRRRRNRCEAKTRAGGKCQNMPMQLGGRRRMHGGASLRGPEHPRYKDGKYSKYWPADIEELLAYWRAQPPADLSYLYNLPNPLEGLELDVDLSELLK